jgi:hypothetical protein
VIDWFATSSSTWKVSESELTRVTCAQQAWRHKPADQPCRSGPSACAPCRRTWLPPFLLQESMEGCVWLEKSAASPQQIHGQLLTQSTLGGTGCGSKTLHVATEVARCWLYQPYRWQHSHHGQ